MRGLGGFCADADAAPPASVTIHERSARIQFSVSASGETNCDASPRERGARASGRAPERTRPATTTTPPRARALAKQHKQGALIKSWKQRYFSLDNGELKYFISADAKQSKGIIALKYATAVDRNTAVKLPKKVFGEVIQLVTKGRTYLVRAQCRAMRARAGEIMKKHDAIGQTPQRAAGASRRRATRAHRRNAAPPAGATPARRSSFRRWR